MSSCYRLLLICCTAVVLSLLGGLSSCGSGTQAPNSGTNLDSRLEISWPPEANPTRTVSDDEVVFLGNQFSLSEGNIENIPPDTDITFSQADPYSYVMYSLTGFLGNIEPGSIVVDYSVEDPIGSEGSTLLYFGVSNYTMGTWSWYLGDPESPEIIFSNPSELPAENGNLHLVVVHQGVGTAELVSVTFRRLGDTTLFPPENLVATPDVGEILLTWDEAPGASGYNVYRNAERNSEDYGDPLNPVPLTETTFLDDLVSRNLIYFYRVTSVSHIESEMGGRVDIFSPQEDLYLPLNFHVSDRGIDFFRVRWEWEGAEPDGWTLALKEQDDFDLLEPVTFRGISLPFVRTYKFSGLVPGKTYYWRICAYVNGKRGRMTDDMPGVTEGLWTWEPVEEIGPGMSPLSVVTADNDLSVVYINGVNGGFARRNGGFWNAEIALESMLTTPGGFVSNIDIDYGNSKYVIAGFDPIPGDVIAATGTPGNWDQLRIDGDGSNALGHPNSGSVLQVVANDNYFLATYLNDDSLEFAFQITPTDTISWTSKATIWPIFNGDLQYSLASTADNFHMLWYEYEPGNEGLKFFSYDDAAWNMVDMFPDGSSEIGHYSDLTMSSAGEWFSPAYNPIEFEMHFIHESESTWTSILADGNDRQGDYANMVAVGDRMFSVFKNRDQGFWMMAIYDAGVWKVSPLSVPGADIRLAKLTAIGDTPYIVYHDQDGDLIMCAPGVPPVD